MTTAYKVTDYVGGGSGALDAIDGDLLSDDDFAFVMTASGLSVHVLDESSGATESSPEIIAPDTNAGTKRWLIRRMISDSALPEGAIIPWIGGYFTDGNNGGFTDVLGNTVSLVNARFNAEGKYVCDGSELNNSSSNIFNGSGRYLPNATDDRFFMGDTAAGNTGGSNTMPHTHTTGSHTLTTAEMPPHAHAAQSSGSFIAYDSSYPLEVAGGSDKRWGLTGALTEETGGGDSHNHGATGAASNTENKPQFLSCFYLMQVT